MTGLLMQSTHTSRDSQDAIISVVGLSKVYASGFQALDNVDLTIRKIDKYSSPITPWGLLKT